MKRVLFLLFCLIVFNFFICPDLFAQNDIKSDTLKTKKVRNLKNTVWFNLTNPVLLSDNSLIFGYERVLGPHQTFTVNFGATSLPNLNLLDVNINNTDIQLSKNSTNQGYNVSLDYRFYLNKVNKFSAPRGVYIAPYYSYNHFQKKNTWSLNTNSFTGDVNTDFRLDINTLGGELGYQFILWKRVALDFVLFGPGMAQYKLQTKLSTTLSAEDQSELFQIINDYLSDKLPGYNFVIDDQEFKKSGSTKTTTFGFRYMIHLGFRF